MLGYEVREKRCAMLVWEDDGIYIELELEKATMEKVEEVNNLLGFPPKGKVINHRYLAEVGE